VEVASNIKTDELFDLEDVVKSLNIKKYEVDIMENQKEKLVEVLKKVPEFKGMKIIIPDEVLEKIDPEIIQDLLNE